MPQAVTPQPLAEAHWRQVDAIRALLVASLIALYQRGDVDDDTFVERGAALTLAAQRLAVRQVDAYFSAAASQVLDVAPEPIGLDAERLIGKSARRGVSVEDIMHRAAWARAVDGFERGLSYLRQQAVTNVTLATRQAEYAAMQADTAIVGYIRINNPGGGKVCGLCVAAATRIYRKIEKQQLHTHCRCTTAAIYDTDLKGVRTIDRRRLEAVYRDSDGRTDFNTLGRLRYRAEDLPPAVDAEAIAALEVRVVMDRELGPMLTGRRHDSAFAL